AKDNFGLMGIEIYVNGEIIAEQYWEAFPKEKRWAESIHFEEGRIIYNPPNGLGWNLKKGYSFWRSLRMRRELIDGKKEEWPCYYELKKGYNEIKIAVKDVGNNWTGKVIKVELAE
ncbi:MAG: hypothetical protein J7L42_00555, partial [Elusimicrobia bacterium]|nr:hypothetical protein [Elusimicrobiota bacterium]